MHITLSSGCAWSFWTLFEGCGRNGSFPSSNKQQKAVIAERGFILRKGGKKRECDQPRCISLELVSLSFLPLKLSQANSWDVSSAFSISGQSLVLGDLLVDAAAVPVQGHTHAWEKNDLFLVEMCGR